MKLYEITNGYIGESYVRMLIIAEDAISATRRAYPDFYKEGMKSGYKERYWINLQATELCADTSQKWHGEITDG